MARRATTTPLRMAAAAASALAMSVSTLAAVPADAAPTCFGEPATITRSEPSPEPLVGTAGDDVIIGSPGDDVIQGLGGDDLICAGDGDDLVDGGVGNDRISGDLGDDVLRGRGGRNVLIGRHGNDTLIGGHRRDRLKGAGGGDTLRGRAGPDRLLGGPGNDYLNGSDGSDWLDGQDGEDIVDGGPGDDVIWELHLEDTHDAEGTPEAAGDTFAYDSITVVPRNGFVLWEASDQGPSSTQGHEGVLNITNRPDGLLMIETIAPERYLLGIAEVFFDWPAASLEAQVIAARTYLARVLDAPWGPMVTYGFDICDWSLCQVYLGTKLGVDEPWEEAVTSTEGQVLLHGGDPAWTFYHSTSGDTTRNVEDVWGGSPVPYLKAVEVPDQDSPYADWFYTLTLEDFLEVLALDDITFPGEVERIWTRITEPGEGPYEVVVRTSEGRWELEITDVQIALNRHAVHDPYRASLPPLLRALGQAALSPTFITRLRDDGNVAVRGQGWGHQIGLGQYGAKAMALSGSTGAEILSHFYTGLAPEPDPGFIPELVDIGLAYGNEDRVIVLRPEARAVLRSGPRIAVLRRGAVTITRFGEDAVAISFGD